jgi:hypothetical protein
LPADGAISGAPGSVIGWGYTITNESDQWLDIYNFDPGSFAFATADPSIFDYPILAPGATQTVAYDASGPFAVGLLQLTWDSIVPDGVSNVGTFLLSGRFWDGDPFDGGNLLDGTSIDRTAGYSATMAPVPEPGTLLLLGSGAAGLLLRRRKRASVTQG